MKLREFWILQSRCTGTATPFSSESLAIKHIQHNDDMIHFREVNPALDAAWEECERALDRVQEIVTVIKNVEDVDKDWLLEVLGAPIFTEPRAALKKARE